jgi:hypothetical protein
MPVEIESASVAGSEPRPRLARMSITARAAVLSAVGVLLMASCGGGENGQPAGTTRNATTDAPDPMPDGSTRPNVAKATNAETALLTDVRVGRHPGFERVVFEFRNTVPGYDVRYVKRPVRADASGAVVNVAGRFVLRVRMENALDADLSRESVPRTYTGPNRLTPDTTQIEEVVRTGGFEAVLTWVVGVNDHTPFRVIRLHDPPRLVVDSRSR